MPTQKPETSQRLPKTLSHYTTLDGLKGIIDSKSLWASNASFLNDKAELDHALAASEAVIRKLASEGSLTKWLQLIERVFQKLAEGAKPDTYVTCFCEDDDNLSQWRGYGGVVQGVSITFGRASLATRFKPEGGEFFKVKYSKYSTASKLKKDLSGHIDDIANLDSIGNGLTPAQKYEHLLSRVSSLLPRFKHIGFKDEREWRFCFQRKVNDSDINFRTSSTKIVPYMVVGQSEKTLPIASVRIGPGPDPELTARSVATFLLARGYQAEVKTSEVPFRL